MNKKDKIRAKVYLKYDCKCAYCGNDIAIDKYYYHQNKIILRPIMNLDYDRNKMHLSCNDFIHINRVPLDTCVIVQGEDYGICNDGEILIKCEYPDIYIIQLINFPYISETFEYYAD